MILKDLIHTFIQPGRIVAARMVIFSINLLINVTMRGLTLNTVI
jgi:hypothetical protein